MAVNVDALNSHRESYITEYDFAQMASLGIQHGNAGLPVAVPTPAPLFPDLEVAADAMDCRNPPVRLPVGWWVFASSPLPVESTLLPDPCYPEQQFVTVSAGMMDTLLRQGQVGQQRAERSLRRAGRRDLPARAGWPSRDAAPVGEASEADQRGAREAACEQAKQRARQTTNP